MTTKVRVIILGTFAAVLLLMAIFYNTAGGDTPEGGGPCFGVASMIFVGLVIGLWWMKKPPQGG
jgi:hypothetical protein